jgi:hypothetical protein
MEIWKIYTYSDPDMAVSRAIASGLLKKEKIPENLLDILDLKIGFFTDAD